jgi:hypothetical protein
VGEGQGQTKAFLNFLCIWTEIQWVLLVTSKARKACSSSPGIICRPNQPILQHSLELTLPLQLTLNYVPSIANSGMYYAHGQGEPPQTVIGKRPALLFLV